MKTTLISALLASCLLSACGESTQTKTSATESVDAQAVETQPSLAKAFEGRFLIGAALSENQIMGKEAAALDLVAHHFNALTAENEMKWERLHPEETRYYWDSADALTQFAAKHGMFVTGHALVWHHQTPDWVFEDEQGQPASRELLLQRMEQHIATVVGRYKDSVQSWDVVNEALNEDGTMRESRWQQIIGDDYVEKAFEFAHKADPDAELYYNDYNLFKPEKRAGAVRLVKSIQEKGIPVHGIGMQGHYGIDNPKDLSVIEDSILAYAPLGKVMVTELDISVLPFPSEGNEGADIGIDLELQAKFNPYVDGMPDDVNAAYEAQYLNVFKLFLKHQDTISRVTFWGVNDAQSWRNGWPMEGRTDYPLLIDRENNLKPVAYNILELLDE